MEHLSKQQIVLVTLLVSFVTSLSTGIVTVSLMDQAPQGVVQTINHVVEKIVAQEAAVGSARTAEDALAAAVSLAGKAVVKIQTSDAKDIVGIGVVVSSDGIIMTDKSIITPGRGYMAVLSNAAVVPVAVIQSQIKGDIVFLAPTIKVPFTSFSPIAFGRIPKLGQTVMSLSGTGVPVLGQGIVSSLDIEHINPDGSQPAFIDTTIAKSKAAPGSLLLDSSGQLIGLSTTALHIGENARFYPLSQLKEAIPSVK